MSVKVLRVPPATSDSADSRLERQIITSLVVSDEFCSAAKPFFRSEALRLPYAKPVARWCWQYFEKYHRAPRRHIEDLFASEATVLSPEEAEAVRTFLASISEEYQADDGQCNWQLRIDQAERYFRLSALDDLRSRIKDVLITGHPEEGERLVTGYVRPSRPANKGIDPIKDLQASLNALKADESAQLFDLPGDLGRMTGPISRGRLTALVGPSGVGKTWWLIYLAARAVFRGYNVAFFSLEMPEEEIAIRVQQMITGHPTMQGRVLIPVWDCALNQYGLCPTARAGYPRLRNGAGERPDFGEEPKNYSPCYLCRGDKTLGTWYPETWWKAEDRPLMDEAIITAKHRAIMSNTGGRIGDLHVTAFPSGMLSVNDVRSYIKNREYYEGVVTDVIITDSADKMRSDANFNEPRHGIYNIWMGHKALAEEFHAAVITPSHSNTERTGKRIRQGDWAEDIRKLRESDLAIAINQSPEDKRAGRYLMSMLKLRKGSFDLSRTVMVACCLDIGRPYIDSVFEKRPPKTPPKK